MRLGILAGQRTLVVETSAVDTCIVLFGLLYIYSWNGLLDGEEEEVSSCRESLGKQPGSIIDSNASPAQRQKV